MFFKHQQAKNLRQAFRKKLTPEFLRLQKIIQVKEIHETVLFPWRSTWLDFHMKDCISKSNVQKQVQLNNKTFTPQLYRLQQRICEYKFFKKIVWSSRFIESKFDRGGGGGASNSCNSEWNSALKFFIVRTDYELNEREQIALALFDFLGNSLLLFFCKSKADFERSKSKPRARQLRVFLNARLGHIMLYLEIQ